MEMGICFICQQVNLFVCISQVRPSSQLILESNKITSFLIYAHSETLLAEGIREQIPQIKLAKLLAVKKYSGRELILVGLA